MQGKTSEISDERIDWIIWLKEHIMLFFYIQIIPNINAMAAEMIAWENFCKTNRPTGIWIFDRIDNDCKIVESPPKLIINVAPTAAQIPLKFFEIDIHPFVISISPSITQESWGGNRENKGLKAVVMTKKMAIIAPTDIMFKAESIIICDKSACFFLCFKCSLFVLLFCL